MDKVMNADLDHAVMDLAVEMQRKFSKMDQEQLITRLIASQLTDPVFRGAGADLNAKSGDRGDRGDRSDRGERRSGKDGFNRYFINIGTVDHVNKSDLIEFLAESANLEPKFIGQVSIQKNCAYFDVDDQHDKGFGQKFKDITVSGRAIRVNRDHEGVPKGSNNGNSNKYHSKDNRSKKRHGGAHKRKGRRR
jgi:ATP-dependent RNA helicase DeaD